MAPEPLAPAGEARASGARPSAPSAAASASTFGPSFASTAGSRVSVAASTKTTLSMIPSAIERKAGLGTSITAESEISTVSAGEEDGLAGGVHRHRDRVARRELRAEEGAAEAVDDEERVVDPEREREHQREVHRPDRDLEAVREQRQQPGRGDEAEDRQQQRQPGGDERAEGEHEDRERHRPGEELRLHHRRCGSRR